MLKILLVQLILRKLYPFLFNLHCFKVGQPARHLPHLVRISITQSWHRRLAARIADDTSRDVNAHSPYKMDERFAKSTMNSDSVVF